MNMRWKYLFKIVALCVAGSVHAATPHLAADRNVATPPAALVDSDRSTAPVPGAPAGLSAGASDRVTNGNVAGTAPEIVLAGLSNPPDTAPPQRSDRVVAGALPDTALSPNRVGDEAPALVLAQLSSVYPSATSASRDRAAFLFSADELPKPAGWMTLICGLLVGAFMVRRKREHYAD